jgi:hypothetical protein
MQNSQLPSATALTAMLIAIKLEWKSSGARSGTSFMTKLAFGNVGAVPPSAAECLE